MRLAVDDSIWADVLRVMRRYEGERHGLGDEFLDAVDAGLANILAAPAAWAVWPDLDGGELPLRRYVMKRFPYAIGYHVVAAAVVVVVVTHTSQEPGHWR